MVTVQSPNVPHSNLLAARQLEPPPRPPGLSWALRAYLDGAQRGIWTSLPGPSLVCMSKLLGLGRCQQSVICSSLVLGFVSFFFKFQSGLFYKGCVGGKLS